MDVAIERGIDFVHDHGGSGQRYMVETNGSGVAWIDFDGDGWSDIYWVQSAPLPGAQRSVPPTNRLYRNLEGRRFEDETAAAGVGDTGYGQGVAVGDYDRDGDPDLYVVNFGANVLYRNDGGKFTDVTELAGVGDARWGSSAAFGDLDGDGWPDLYVVNYVDFGLQHHIFCGDPARDIRTYCGPQVYNGLPDVMYINTRDGAFRNASQGAGIDNPAGKGLGVLISDFDADGRLDIYVANDQTPNFLYQRSGENRWHETAPYAGVAYNFEGKALAGMGVDSGDIDGDGDLDIVVTNFSFEGLSFLRNHGDSFFEDISSVAGLLTPSFLSVGFGMELLDFDNDSDLDLVVGNGHVMDNVDLVHPGETYAQLPQLYRNTNDGRYELVGEKEGGAVLGVPLVARGLASCDYDNDGDMDVALAINGGQAQLWENRGPVGGAVELRLMAASGEQSPVGARVEAQLGERLVVREQRGGGSYESAPDQRVHIGLGPERAARIEVRWPSGKREALGEVSRGELVEVHEGRGIVQRHKHIRRER